MKTNIRKEGETIIVSIDGTLDFENQVPLKDDLQKLVKHTKVDSTARKIIFDLKNLEFVGSSGISAFVQTLREFNQAAPSKPVYFNVKSEFKKVMRAFDEFDTFDFGDTPDSKKKHWN